MDQVLMVSARPLMSEVIEEGRRLIRGIREAPADVKLDVTAAYWDFLSDLERWRLVIASRFYDREGPIRAYSRLGSIYDKIWPRPRIPITDLEFAGAGERRVRALQKRFDFQHEEIDTIMEHVSLDGEYFEVVYLYQLSEI